MTVKSTIRSPSRSELLSIRILILLGFISMGAFLYIFFQAGHAQRTLLYWLLLFTIMFTCIRIAAEGYIISILPCPRRPR